MYQFLQKYVGPKIAGTVTVVWYLLLILLIFYYQFRTAGQFRYVNW